MDKLKSNAKSHNQRYKNKAGERVPGVTTFLGVLAKPALVPWANKLGLQGIDVSKYVDSLAGAGTCAHYMIECYLKREKPDLSNFTSNQIELAENSVLKFYDWEKKHTFEVIGSELVLISEKYQYGLTIDLYCKLDGKKTLIDFKTAKAIWPEMGIQLSAYKAGLEENGYEVEDARILRIGRDEVEGFEDRQITNLDKNFELFKHCVAVYNLQKEIRNA